MIDFRIVVRMEEVRFSILNYLNFYIGNEILVKDEILFII